VDHKVQGEMKVVHLGQPVRKATRVIPASLDRKVPRVHRDHMSLAVLVHKVTRGLLAHKVHRVTSE
jgi:hypothetical protein